jgi:hypothetical protein
MKLTSFLNAREKCCYHTAIASHRYRNDFVRKDDDRWSTDLLIDRDEV